MVHKTLTYIPAPWVDGDPAFPSDWVEGWARGGTRDGRARVTALTELQSRLQVHGVQGVAIVGGPWLLADASRPGIWRVGPWSPASDPSAKLHAVGAGEVDAGWIAETLDAFLSDEDCLQPTAGPCVYLSPGGVLFDPSFMDSRDAFVLLRLGEGAEPFVRGLLEQRAAWWVVLMVAAAVRSDAFWTRWDELVELVVGGVERPWTAPADRPVNPQEVTLRVAEVADAWAGRAAVSFDAAAVGIFLPDPDDEYIYALGVHGCERYAYDAGLVRRKPAVDDVGFGLTAAHAVGAAFDPTGRPVVVRDVADRASLRLRYLDLGFDPEAVAADQPSSRGPYTSEHFLAPDRLQLAKRGPWVFTAQQLPVWLSASGRNIVMSLQGRTVSGMWEAPGERRTTSRDRRARIAVLARRVHDDIVRLIDEGLRHWGDGLRGELLRELGSSAEPAALCRTIAAWTSTRTVSLWTLEGRELVLSAWSRSGDPPPLRTDPEDHLDSRELRLLAAPLYPRRSDVGGEGFLGWPDFELAMGGAAENVGTWPLVRDRRTIGLLRLDGAMSLMAGHVPRRSSQGALHHHRPTVLPQHLRRALEEVAQLLVLSRSGETTGGWTLDWSRFVRDVLAGDIHEPEARRTLDDLYDRAPQRGEAAGLVGVHRNTFTRHLDQIETLLGSVPWR